MNENKYDTCRRGDAMQETKLSKNPIRTVLMLEGIVFGLASIAHGVFEIFQGNVRVPGLVSIPA